MSSFVDESSQFIRENRTKDIVKRIGVITADRVHFANHPIDSPVSIFNPAILLDGDYIKMYARIVLGYFTYASAVMDITIPLSELGELTKGALRGRMILRPDNNYDIWGVEDPRVCRLSGRKTITYCGRTVNYFRPGINRVLPIVATNEGTTWKKKCVFKYEDEKIVSDKDAFLVDLNGLRLFHRIHTTAEEWHCVVNEIERDVLDNVEIGDVVMKGATIPLKGAEFEDKIGWGTPPVEIGNKYLLLLHGLDRLTQWYKVFAVLMDDHARVTATTRFYVMEPKESYEVYGDRPFTVFPCGLCRFDDKLLVSYGAADLTAALGEIDLNELMYMLESNKT